MRKFLVNKLISVIQKYFGKLICYKIATLVNSDQFKNHLILGSVGSWLRDYNIINAVGSNLLVDTNDSPIINLFRSVRSLHYSVYVLSFCTFKPLAMGKLKQTKYLNYYIA